MANFKDPRVVGYGYPTLSSTTEYKRFNNEYFSGADIRIYFGDIWLDEVTSLQFTLSEQVQPIFGYASYTWDAVARGTRMVQGSFSINFKESFYLQSALNRLQSKLEGRKKDANAVFNEENFKQGLTVEHLVSKAYNDASFGSIADQFEKTFWGKSANKNMTTRTNLKNKSTYFYPDYSDPSLGAGISQKELRDNGFNILITYGPYNEIDGSKVSGSATSIVGVQITSVGQVIGGDGNPVQEVYEFIAKDLNGNIK